MNTIISLWVKSISFERISSIVQSAGLLLFRVLIYPAPILLSLLVAEFIVSSYWGEFLIPMVRLMASGSATPPILNPLQISIFFLHAILGAVVSLYIVFHTIKMVLARGYTYWFIIGRFLLFMISTLLVVMPLGILIGMTLVFFEVFSDLAQFQQLHTARFMLPSVVVSYFISNIGILFWIESEGSLPALLQSYLNTLRLLFLNAPFIVLLGASYYVALFSLGFNGRALNLPEGITPLEFAIRRFGVHLSAFFFLCVMLVLYLLYQQEMLEQKPEDISD